MKIIENYYVTIILLFIICTTSCTVGNLHNNQNLNNITSAEQAKQEIQVGMSMQQVYAKWGKPDLEHNTNDTIYWVYGHQTATVTGLPWMDKVDRKTINVVFRNSRVVDVLYQRTNTY